MAAASKPPSPSRPTSGRTSPPRRAFQIQLSLVYSLPLQQPSTARCCGQALLIVMVLVCSIDQAVEGVNEFAFNFEVDFDFGVDDVSNVVESQSLPILCPTADDTSLKVLGSSLFLWIYSQQQPNGCTIAEPGAAGGWSRLPFVVPALFNQFSDLLPTDELGCCPRRALRGFGRRGNVHCLRTRATTGSALIPEVESGSAPASPATKN